MRGDNAARVDAEVTSPDRLLPISAASCLVLPLQDLTCPNILQLDGKCRNLCNCIVSCWADRVVGGVGCCGALILLIGRAAEASSADCVVL